MFLSHTQAFIWLVALALLFLPVAVYAIYSKHIVALYQRHFAEVRQERLFLSSIAFFITFAITRLITHSIHKGIGPFHNFEIGGRHIHHLVFGIILLMTVGYIWLLQVGTGVGNTSRWGARVTAILYGIGMAITLDEFALWYNLADVYWAREGRESIDAIIFFGVFLSIGYWGGRFFHSVIREIARVFKK